MDKIVNDVRLVDLLGITLENMTIDLHRIQNPGSELVSVASFNLLDEVDVDLLEEYGNHKVYEISPTGDFRLNVILF